MLAKIAGGGGPFLNGLGADVGMGRRSYGYGYKRRGIGRLGDDTETIAFPFLSSGGDGSLMLPPPPVGPSSAPGTLPSVSLPTAAGSTSAPSVWDQLALLGGKTTATIATNLTRPAGFYQVTGPGGQTVTYQMPTTGPAAGLTPTGLPFTLPSIGSANLSTILLVGGGVLAVALLFGSMKR